MQLMKYKKIKGKIRLITGLHIGGSKDEIRIGETDNPVIRHSLSGMPYIPGSSLKGKIRTLLEWHLDKVDSMGHVHSCSDQECQICRIFGTTDKGNTCGPSRALFRDCQLTPESVTKLENLQKEKGLMYIEEKTENVIDRLSGKAKTGGLRQMERVPAGMEFDFQLDYRIFSMENEETTLEEELFETLKLGLELLKQDALGGSGSRGYGKIEFIDLVDSEYTPNQQNKK